MKLSSRIVICGQSQHEAVRWAALAAEFGFELEFVPDISALCEIPNAHTISSVFVNFAEHADSAAALSSQIRQFVPNARLILAKPMASSLTPSDLIDTGVFHSLSHPIHPGEMRQSLGFLWSALQQDAAAQNKNADPPAADVESATEESARTKLDQLNLTTSR